MSFLANMYSQIHKLENSTKNPNRVAGGLRAQGVDTFTILDEQGSQRQIPSHSYVKSLEDQIKMQKESIRELEKRISKQGKAISTLSSKIDEYYSIIANFDRR